MTDLVSNSTSGRALNLLGGQTQLAGADFVGGIGVAAVRQKDWSADKTKGRTLNLLGGQENPKCLTWYATPQADAP